MTEQTPKEQFLQSLERCSAEEDFIPAFYERFMSSSEEVKVKFRFTDFEHQNRMLLRSLELCAGATSGEPETLCELSERAATHDRRHLDIKPPMYDFWLEAIVATAREFDPQWNESVEAAWRRILGYAVEHMLRKY